MFITPEFIALCAIIFFAGAIITILKKGFNEIIKGMEAMNEKLEKIEQELKKQDQ